MASILGFLLAIILTVFNGCYTHGFLVSGRFHPDANEKFKKYICIATGVITFVTTFVTLLAVSNFQMILARHQAFSDYANFESCLDS